MDKSLEEQLYDACIDALKKLEWPIYTEKEIKAMEPCRKRLQEAIGRYVKEVLK